MYADGRSRMHPIYCSYFIEFQKQIEEAIAKTEQLEESTKNLDVEAKQLHNKFKQNREICEG